MTKMTDLERDIAESRERLDRTIDRLQDRMTASGVADDVLGTARRHGYGPTIDRAARAVRENPLPVLLIAAGVGWLALTMSETARRKKARDELRRRGVWDGPPRRHVAGDEATEAEFEPDLDRGPVPVYGRSPTDPDIEPGTGAYGRRPSGIAPDPVTPGGTTADPIVPERPSPYAPVTGTTGTNGSVRR